MVLCFDIGGTSIKYGAAHDPGGEIVFSSRWETPTDAKTLGGAGVERKLLDLIGGLAGKYNPSGIAVSTAGMVDHRTGAIPVSYTHLRSARPPISQSGTR